MNKDRAKEMIAVMRAWVDGKEVECQSRPGTGWYQAANPVFNFAEYEYRVKPEPTWRAWKPEEVPRLVVLNAKDDGGFYPRVWELTERGKLRCTGMAIVITLEEALEDYRRVMEDRTESPCGVLVSQ